MPLSIDESRLRETFESYSRIGATVDDGLCRLALSDADRTVRDRFVDDLRDSGYSIRVDELGNIFARRPGRRSDADPVLIGSHLDSQPNGGRYDGQLGVLVALETLRTLEDQNIETDRPIDIVNWTNEEGCRFQPSMMGSGAFSGKYSVGETLSVTDRDGRSVGDELERIGYDGVEPCPHVDPHAYLELHIEQGPILEQKATPVGVVDGVFGLTWLRATVRGESDHAGPTPMHTRNDALATATDVITTVRSLPNRLSADAVATVGELEVSPNSINVIPNEVSFTVDIRSYDHDVIETARREVRRELEATCDRHGTSFELELLGFTEPIEFSSTVRESIVNAAETTSIPYDHLVSGAGHDAQRLHSVTDAGLLFVPSVDGKTHVESEYTRWEDIVDGAIVFANATANLAG